MARWYGYAGDPAMARHYEISAHAQVLVRHPKFDWDACVDTASEARLAATDQRGGDLLSLLLRNCRWVSAGCRRCGYSTRRRTQDGSRCFYSNRAAGLNAGEALWSLGGFAPWSEAVVEAVFFSLATGGARAQQA